ncbi:hypothetical protein V8V55_22250, partial [Priestia megaterium]|uniref:hypothetical protein n=1 Tax=Priestia megaterium TaxID=1404 RepID=UPI0030089206
SNNELLRCSSYNKINPAINKTAPSITRNPEEDTGSVAISDATAKKTKASLVFPFIFLIPYNYKNS